MEDKEFFEDMVIDNLENFNVYDVHFIQAFRFFYDNYDYELPKEYKDKLLTVLSDIGKVEKDMKVKRDSLKSLDIEKLSNYLKNLKKFISEDFSLGTVFDVPEKEAAKEYEKALSENRLDSDHDVVIHYIEVGKHLLNYFSTNLYIKMVNPFLEELKANEDKRAANLISNNDLEVHIVSFDVKCIETDLEEFVFDYYE